MCVGIRCVTRPTRLVPCPGVFFPPCCVEWLVVGRIRGSGVPKAPRAGDGDGCPHPCRDVWWGECVLLVFNIPHGLVVGRASAVQVMRGARGRHRGGVGGGGRRCGTSAVCPIAVVRIPSSVDAHAVLDVSKQLWANSAKKPKSTHGLFCQHIVKSTAAPVISTVCNPRPRI